MECETLVGVVLAVIVVVVVWAVVQRRRAEKENMPPGPTCWPILGNIFQLGWSPHVSFAKLARKHGPIMTLWLGSMCTVVVSSSEAARHMFKNHDVVLAGRKIYESMKGRHGNQGSLITSQYGPHWRMLRRLCTAEFFASSRLDAMRGVRWRCVERMVRLVEEHGECGTRAVELGKLFFLMNFNLIGNLIFSEDLLEAEAERERERERGARFYYHAVKVMEYAGKPNVADFVPLLRWVDPQGIRRKTQYHVERAFHIAGLFIKERIRQNNNKNRTKDFLDVLLDFPGPYTFCSTTINVLIFEMFTAGTDTTTSTMEWAMAELLHNPRVMEKVQREIRSKIGRERKMEEKDMDELPYLNAVIKETLRLHPPLPFLVPHMAMESCTMMGYHIPKDSQILVNVWAIGRDPKLWDAPLLFRPERFLELEPNAVDFKGHHFDFIPFGSGRRMCPAMPLAARVLPLAVGSLLYKFDWVLADGLKPEEMDMREGMGITLRKALPLKAIPLPYTPHA